MSFIFPVCKQHEHFTEGRRGEKQCLWEPTNPLLTGLQSAACAHLLSHLIRSHPLTSSCWLCWVWLLFVFGIASGISISSWNLLIVAGLPTSEPSWGFKWAGKGSAKIQVFHKCFLYTGLSNTSLLILFFKRLFWGTVHHCSPETKSIDARQIDNSLHHQRIVIALLCNHKNWAPGLVQEDWCHGCHTPVPSSTTSRKIPTA